MICFRVWNLSFLPRHLGGYRNFDEPRLSDELQCGCEADTSVQGQMLVDLSVDLDI